MDERGQNVMFEHTLPSHLIFDLKIKLPNLFRAR